MEKELWRWTEAENFTHQTSVTSDLSVICLLSGLSLTDCIKENFLHYEFVLVAAYMLKLREALVKFLPFQSTLSECNKMAMLCPFVTEICLRFQNFIYKF